MSEPKMIRVRPIGTEGLILEGEVVREGPSSWDVRLAPCVRSIPLFKHEWELVESTVDKLNKLGVHAVVALRADDSVLPFVKDSEGNWQRFGRPYDSEYVPDLIDNDGWEVIFPGLEES